MYATRWRSLVTLVPTICVATVLSVFWIVYRCEETDLNDSTTRILSGLLYTAIGVAGLTYFGATLFVLSCFALRIYHYGNIQESKVKIYFKLIKKHFVILIPPVICLLCVLPYLIWLPWRSKDKAYFHCEISSVEYVLKLIVQTIPNLPTCLTWLMFVYPSKVNRTEFYVNTCIGRMWIRSRTGLH
jgi:hypothetical protein